MGPTMTLPVHTDFMFYRLFKEHIVLHRRKSHVFSLFVGEVQGILGLYSCNG